MGRGEGGRPGAAPHGVRVQAGSEGGSEDRLVGRVRRPTERRSRPAATAEAGPGGGGRPGAAPYGAGVQAGGEGGNGLGAAFTRPAQRVLPAGRGGAPAKVGVGLPVPRPLGGLIPICRVCGGNRAGAGAPCASPQHPDYIYQRVVSLEAPTTPSSITQSGQGRPSLQGKSDIPPPRRPCPGSGPPHPGLPGRSNPRTPARPGPFEPLGARSGPGCAPGNHRGALAVRRAPLPAITLRIHPGQRGAAVSEAADHDARATRAPRSRPQARPDRPTPFCRTRPTGRSPPPPSPPARTSAPRDAAPDRPAGPPPALAARLGPGPVGHCARATTSAPPPPLPSPPAWTFAPRGAAPDRPAGPPPALAARLDLHPVGHCARATTFAPPPPLPSPLVWAFAPRVPRPVGVARPRLWRGRDVKIIVTIIEGRARVNPVGSGTGPPPLGPLPCGCPRPAWCRCGGDGS